MSFSDTTFRTCRSLRLLLWQFNNFAVSEVQYSSVWSTLIVGNLTLAIRYGLMAFLLEHFDNMEISSFAFYTNGFTQIKRLIEPDQVKFNFKFDFSHAILAL